LAKKEREGEREFWRQQREDGERDIEEVEEDRTSGIIARNYNEKFAAAIQEEREKEYGWRSVVKRLVCESEKMNMVRLRMPIRKNNRKEMKETRH